MKTIDWKSKTEAKALLIGHDPRLQNSNTIANYALFADYYFKPIPNIQSEKRKYGLAKSSFEYILNISNNTIKPEQVYITNLCNDPLSHAPKGKTVLIPQIKAEQGIENISKILRCNPIIKYVFPMSLQVNYWLQKLGFYFSSQEFIDGSEPKGKGIANESPYYEPQKGRTFLSICGNQYMIDNGNRILIPILHVKNFPLTSKFAAYMDSYRKINEFFDKL